MRCSFLLAGFIASNLAFAEVKVMEEIVCKVNGDIITRTELERDRARLTEELRRQGLSGARLNDAVNTRVKDLLRDRIDNLLLISRGKELQLNVDSDVNRQLADIQRKSVTQDKALADPEKFQAFVKEQTGQSYEDYKADMKNSLLAQRVVREEVSGKIKFKREELQAYYDAHQDQYQREERIFLREILVAANPDNTAIAEKKAKDLVAQARKGEKFPELAMANSDAASAQAGGFIDPYTKAQLSPELITAVWEQPKGYITDPIKLPGGYLILKVDDHQKAGLASLDEVEAEVTDQLFSPHGAADERLFDQAAGNRVSGNQTRLRGFRSSARQGHQVERPGAVETRNYHQGRSAGEGPPQEDSGDCPGTRHHRHQAGVVLVPLA